MRRRTPGLGRWLPRVLELLRTLALFVVAYLLCAALHGISLIPDRLDAVAAPLRDQAQGLANVTDAVTLLRGQQAFDAWLLQGLATGSGDGRAVLTGSSNLIADKAHFVPFVHFTTNEVNRMRSGEHMKGN